MIKLAALLAVALLLCGCDAAELPLSSCGTSDPDPEFCETCPGRCVPIPSLGEWDLPVLLWSGPELEAPACPERAPKLGYEGHADPSDPPECLASCSCDPPIGTCELPSVLTAHTDPMCSGTTQDFWAPDPWDGSCDSTTSVPMIFGAESVTVEPLTLIESGCKPTVPSPPMAGTASWKTFARACRGYGYGSCLDRSMVCAPTAKPPLEGFSECLYQKGDHECPLDYPNKRVFYDDMSDTRHCTDCSCGPPEGGVCSATVSVFKGGSCSDSDWVGGGIATSAGSLCFDLPPGVMTDLKSKMATPPQYQPSVCEPIESELSGSLELQGPSTFCCL